jgi:hypothetical protein
VTVPIKSVITSRTGAARFCARLVHIAPKPPCDLITWLSSHRNRSHVLIRYNFSEDDLQLFAEADRREVDPPIQVEMASWPARLVGERAAGMVGSRTRC